ALPISSCAASLPEPGRTDPLATRARQRPASASPRMRPGSDPTLIRARAVAPRHESQPHESQPHESRPHESQPHEYEGVPMTVNFAAGPQTTQLWERVRPIVAQLEDLPVLAQLADGSLDVTAFTNYIIQDGIYLNGYAKAMSFLAAKTVDRDESRFWAGSAAEAITVEEGMHEDLLADSRLAAAYSELSGGSTASPTTLGYVS